MRVQIDHPQARQHNLQDWLDLHGLDKDTCSRLLAEIARESEKIPSRRSDADRRSLGLDPDSVWIKVVSAICQLLPDHQHVIEDTFQKSKKIAVSGRGKSRRALTIDNGPAAYPTILYSYFGDISDLFVVAHEFGHALQVRASEGVFMPPVMREVCAFLSEAALLSACSRESAFVVENSLNYWHKSNQHYLGHVAIILKKALKDTESRYEYAWNYPIARLLAIHISNGCSSDIIWKVFRADYSVEGVIDLLAK